MVRVAIRGTKYTIYRDHRVVGLNDREMWEETHEDQEGGGLAATPLHKSTHRLTEICAPFSLPSQPLEAQKPFKKSVIFTSANWAPFLGHFLQRRSLLSTFLSFSLASPGMTENSIFWPIYCISSRCNE
ncbi:hypothetical protein AMTRI_Chr06g172460 [Amborella trichopoda]